MWLLSTARAELKFFANPQDVSHPGICILSHTWGKHEQTFQDLQRIRQECARTGANPRDCVSEKIRKCCELAEKDGFLWVWIDTCCIDKTSSAELSEAINSMFRYYSLAAVCYAYLADVPLTGPPGQPRSFDQAAFLNSRWHRRGWTLQELIAPSVVIFFSSSWTALGSKADLAKELERASKVPSALLRSERSLDEFGVAQRMSWAAHRETRREEDEAYCLFGIFGIHMPTLYGEGRHAFYRLQEEIMRTIPDMSLFAWGNAHFMSSLLSLCSAFSFHSDTLQKGHLFAESPASFPNTRRIRLQRHDPSTNPPVSLVVSLG